MHNEFYDEGYEAYYSGESIDDNPYDEETPEYISWEMGFRAGEQEDVEQDPDGN